jgi:hypothetical protein
VHAARRRSWPASNERLRHIADHIRFRSTGTAIGHVRDLLPSVEREFVVLGHGGDLFMPDRVEKQLARMVEKDRAVGAISVLQVREATRLAG